MDTFVLNTHALRMTDEEFFFFCQDNRELRIERDPQRNIIIMAPSGSSTSHMNAGISYFLFHWNQKSQLGKVFDSSGGFQLPSGAIRSADAAWISNERLAPLSPEQLERFAPVCPDFVVELRSPSDRLEPLKEKMAEWLENGARLGWLLDPKEQCTHIYRPGQGVPETLQGFTHTLSGEGVLPGFSLDLTKLG